MDGSIESMSYNNRGWVPVRMDQETYVINNIIHILHKISLYNRTPAGTSVTIDI